MRGFLLFLAIVWLAPVASAQSCPVSSTGEAADVSVLHGTLVSHHELRDWLGLALDRPECGEKEVQLVLSDSEAKRRAESFRGCKVTATGKLYYGQTGYYSANVAISIDDLKHDASCHPVAVEPDPAASNIPRDIHRYFASIKVDFRGKGHVTVEVWKDSERSAPLRPWGAYVNYLLNGAADVIHVGCRDGFRWKDVSLIPKSSRGPVEGPEEMAGVDLNDSVSPNVVTFSCEVTKAPA
jgi:Domain of unknown function (DUF4431)